MPSPLVVCEPDGGLALFRQQAGGWQRQRLAKSGAWPAWSPGGDALAVSVLEPGRRVNSRLEVIDLEGTIVRTMYEAPEGAPPVIAPGVPHYCHWSPDGQRIAYVAPAQEALTLFTGDVEGTLVANPVISGAPLFPAWSQRGDLAVHAGGELVVVGPAGQATLSERAIGFRTPAFSPGGEAVAHAVPSPPGVAVMLSSLDGSGERELHRFPGGVALACRPGSDHLSVSLTRQPEAGLFHELWLLDTGDEAGRVRLHAGPFVASFWAPAGDCVALIVPGGAGDGRYFIRALSAAGKILGTSEAITPSAEVRVMLSFFDQYGLSHSPWARDGSLFAIAGRPAGDGVSASFGDPTNYVMLWKPAWAEPLEIIAPGDAAFFPPPPPPGGSG